MFDKPTYSARGSENFMGFAAHFFGCFGRALLSLQRVSLGFPRKQLFREKSGVTAIFSWKSERFSLVMCGFLSNERKTGAIFSISPLFFKFIEKRLGKNALSMHSTDRNAAKFSPNGDSCIFQRKEVRQGIIHLLKQNHFC